MIFNRIAVFSLIDFIKIEIILFFRLNVIPSEHSMTAYNEKLQMSRMRTTASHLVYMNLKKKTLSWGTVSMN
jgi:hypothetical protein